MDWIVGSALDEARCETGTGLREAERTTGPGSTRNYAGRPARCPAGRRAGRATERDKAQIEAGRGVPVWEAPDCLRRGEEEQTGPATLRGRGVPFGGRWPFTGPWCRSDRAPDWGGVGVQWAEVRH